MARVVLTTFGSLGDLHPFLALGAELGARGHDAVIASHGAHRARAEAVGLAFRAVRPDFTDFEAEPDFMRRAMGERDGSHYVVRELVLPYVRASYADLLEACRDADLLVSHSLTFTAPLVCQRLALPRAHAVLQPYTMFSAHDPPVDPNLPWSGTLRRLGPRVWRVLWALARRRSRPWFRELDALRHELSLPRSSAHPLFDGASDRLNLALFSPAFASPQRDWPPRTVATGFPFHDRDERGPWLDGSLRAFLDAGPPPLVVTLGSSAVWDPGALFTEAAEAARALGRRAVLLVGPEGTSARLPEGVIATGYAPHSELFPRAAAVIHQGGIGTTGQALRAGRPTLIVPFSHDQHDNAARCERLGVARVVRRGQATASRLARELVELLADPGLGRRTEALAHRIRTERGSAAAADAIESLLAGRAGGSP